MLDSDRVPAFRTFQQRDEDPLGTLSTTGTHESMEEFRVVRTKAPPNKTPHYFLGITSEVPDCKSKRWKSDHKVGLREMKR